MMAARYFHSVRTPNTMATAPAMKNGNVSRSTRHSQNSVDSRPGSTTLAITAPAHIVSPTIQSNWRSWMSGPASLRRLAYASASAMNGTSARCARVCVEAHGLHKGGQRGAVGQQDGQQDEARANQRLQALHGECP